MKPWHVEICDVTLRDGEQTPGVSFSCEEKVKIATLLDEIGIEVTCVNLSVNGETTCCLFR